MRALPKLVMLLSLLVLGASCTGPTKEDSERAFPGDARTAELALAAAEGHEDKVRELVEDGVDPNTRGDRGITPLQFALRAESIEGMTALLEAGADPNAPGLGGSSAVHLAAIADESKYLRLLLDEGGDPDVRHGETQAVPLSGAAGPRTDEQFRMLLEEGADPNLPDRTGNTPLHAAAFINAGDHVLLLLEKGADPNAKNAQGATFQPYFFRTDDEVLTDNALQNREKVIAWLEANNIPLDPAAP